MVNGLHELKHCYALNVSDITMNPVYAWSPPPPPPPPGRWDE